MILNLLFTNPLLFLVWIIAIVLALTVHEFCHAWIGYLLGDKTAMRAGRLTLNPISHIDPLGFLMIMTIGIGWAKPVPFNPYNLKYKRWGPAMVGLAGPASNLVSFFILAAATYGLILAGLDFNNLLVVLFVFTMFINAILLFFNIILIPPLDGSKVLYAYLPSPKYDRLKINLEMKGPYLLIGLLILNWVTNGLVLSPIFTGTYFLFKLVGLQEALAFTFNLF